jgi:hypothetical protein
MLQVMRACDSIEKQLEEVSSARIRQVALQLNRTIGALRRQILSDVTRRSFGCGILTQVGVIRSLGDQSFLGGTPNLSLSCRGFFRRSFWWLYTLTKAIRAGIGGEPYHASGDCVVLVWMTKYAALDFTSIPRSASRYHYENKLLVLLCHSDLQDLPPVYYGATPAPTMLSARKPMTQYVDEYFPLFGFQRICSASAACEMSKYTTVTFQKITHPTFSHPGFSDRIVSSRYVTYSRCA